MNDIPAPGPLPADPRRQAPDMLRAVAYQLRRSVLAWIDLGPDEVLYLEGAEDFDRVGPEIAEAVQVHDSKRRVSLRTKKVLEALTNFWRLRSAHVGVPVRLRFLSTAQAAIEQDSPFGPNVAGLELWQHRRLDDREVQLLAEFLQTQEALPETLKRFLGTSSPNELRNKFFECISWDLDSPDAAAVDRVICDKLAVLGERIHNLSYSAAAKTRHRLFTEVFDVAGQRQHARALNRAMFLRLFEEESSVQVSRAELSALRDGIGGRAVQHGIVSSRLDVFTDVPPLPETVEERGELVTQSYQRLEAFGLLLLVGSSGMGKSTLAKLLVSVDQSDGWQWVRFTGQNPNEIVHTLRNINRLLDQDPTVQAIVLDDLDLRPESVGTFEDLLVGLICRFRHMRGRLLLTSQKEPPNKFATDGWIPDSTMCRVPVLGIPELKTLAQRLGCPEDARADLWAAVVRSQTAGHPQLSRAYLAAMRDKGWPKISAESMADVPERMEEHRSDARRLLALLPEADRDLAYRLSVTTRPFQREHVLHIGTKPPPIFAPGGAFDRLRGSWIDTLGKGYFRMSPLLENAAVQDCPPERVQEFNLAIATAMCECGPRTHLEAGTAFRHAWLAHSDEYLSGLMQDFLLHTKKHDFVGIAPELIWFLSVAPAGEVLYPQHIGLSRFLRALQVKVALEIDNELAADVFAAWHEELFNLNPRGTLMEKYILAQDALMHNQVSLPVSRVVQYFQIYADGQQLTDLPSTAIPNPERVYGSVLAGLNDPISHLGILRMTRCPSAVYLTELLSEIDGLSPGLRERIFAALRRMPTETQMVVDSVWLRESEKAEPRWTACLEAFERVVYYGRRWNWPGLALAAVRARTMVYDEFLDDQLAAFAELDTAAAVFGNDIYILDAQRAAVLFHANRPAEALGFWEKAFTCWPAPVEPHDTLPALSARLAAMAAAALSDWHKAADWFRRGSSAMSAGADRPLAAGLLAEAGFFYWRAGMPAECMKALVDGWAILEKLPAGKDNLRAFRTHKTFGHIVLWISNELNGTAHEDPRAIPQAGFASYPETQEHWRELPESNPELLSILLFGVAVRLQQDKGLSDKLRLRSEAIKSGSGRMMFCEILIHHALLSSELSDLPQLENDLREAARGAHVEHLRKGLAAPSSPMPVLERFPRNERGLGADIFFAAMVALAGSSHPCLSLSETWQRAALKLPAGDTLNKWLQEVVQWFQNPVADAMQLLRSSETSWERQIAAALHVATSTEASPSQLVGAQCVLIADIARSPWRLDIENALATLVEDGWQRLARNRWVFQIPRAVPSILAECDRAGEGLAKAARIVLAGMDAIATSFTPALREMLHAHADRGIKL